MIKTIEFVPAMLAYALANFLKRNYDIYPIEGDYHHLENVHNLRKAIKNFLEDNKAIKAHQQ